MISYHNNPKIKVAIMAQLAAHRKADELVKGKYWEGGKGCAVGCTIHSSNHAEYETRFGIPMPLAYLEDRIFEGLENGAAQGWPERFMGGIPVGSDLSDIVWRFLHWLLTEPKVNPGITHKLVRDAVSGCAALMERLARGETVDESAAESATWSARSAWLAARSAAESAAYALMADKLVELLEAA